MKRPDVIIIGAGPIGLEVAAAIQQMGLEPVIVDSGPIGSTIVSLFPPATRFFSSPDRLEVAGFSLTTISQEKSTREEYLAYLRMVSDSLQLDVRTYHLVTGVHQKDGAFELELQIRSGAQRTLAAPHIVLATGGTGRVRTLGVPGESLPHVRHELGDPHQYHGRRVLIVGSRNSACEAAIRCWRAGARVHLSCRNAELHERVKYWIRPELIALIEEGRISAHYETKPILIDEDTVHLQNKDDSISLVDADDVLLMIGYKTDSSLLKAFGVETAGQSEVPSHDQNTMETNVPNVYVAGTATAGTQDRFRVFIENCHIHAHRIAAAISGGAVPDDVTQRHLEEN